MKKFVFTIICVFALISCASSGNGDHIRDEGKRTSDDSGLRNRLSSEMMPSWINTPPRSGSSYFFVGLGEDVSKVQAKKKSIQDALGQVTLLIHTSINKQNSFSSVYSEREDGNTDDFSLEKEGYSNLQIKGQGSIRDFSIRENYHSTIGNKTSWYTLAEIPKDVIKDARKEIIALRERLKKTPAIVLAQNKLQKNVFNNSKLKAFFEDFYKSQGYTIIEGDIFSKDMEGIKKKALREKAKILIYVVIELENVSKESLFYVVEGKLVAREIILDEASISKVEKLYLDNGKGISSQSLLKAFSKLEQNLMDKLTGKTEESRGADSYINY